MLPELPDTIEVVVRQEHIDKGQSASRKSCPIALALREEYPNAEVWATSVYLDKGVRNRYSLPDTAAQFIRIVDRVGKKYVSPFTFTMSRREI